MSKAVLTYSGFAIACFVVIAAFITATTYLQLAAASLLYPLLIFFAYKVIPFRTGWPALKKTAAQVQPQAHLYAKTQEEKISYVGISDIDKRAFLKLIGATGLSFFLISIFGRRFEAFLFGQNMALPGSIGNRQGAPASLTTAASPTEGYKISEIDNGIVGYYGFTNNDGGWLIMKEDTNNGSFRYANGKSDFPGNWKNREKLKYDYFHDLSF